MIKKEPYKILFIGNNNLYENNHISNWLCNTTKDGVVNGKLCSIDIKYPSYSIVIWFVFVNLCMFVQTFHSGTEKGKGACPKKKTTKL